MKCVYSFLLFLKVSISRLVFLFSFPFFHLSLPPLYLINFLLITYHLYCCLHILSCIIHFLFIITSLLFSQHFGPISNLFSNLVRVCRPALPTISPSVLLFFFTVLLFKPNPCPHLPFYLSSPSYLCSMPSTSIHLLNYQFINHSRPSHCPPGTVHH